MDAQLFEAILKDPYVPEPRLVLADSLQEQNDPRGEFISLQCKLGFGRKPDKHEEIFLRTAELLLENGYLWAKPICDLTRKYRFYRGFIDTITMDAEAFASEAAHIYANHPVTTVHLRNLTEKALIEMANLPELRHVRHLYFPKFSQHFKEALHAWLRSEHIVYLETLSLPLMKLTSGDAKEIAAVKWKNLTSLNLSDNTIKDSGVGWLVKSKTLGSLKSLYLNRNKITDKGMIALANATNFEKLEKLSLNGNQIDTEGATAFANSEPMDSLKRLEFWPEDFASRKAEQSLDAMLSLKIRSY
jgi:uncharacterized protein (TIGR02996 family)